MSGPADAEAEPGPTRVPKARRVHRDGTQRGPKLALDVMRPLNVFARILSTC